MYDNATVMIEVGTG